MALSVDARQKEIGTVKTQSTEDIANVPPTRRLDFSGKSQEVSKTSGNVPLDIDPVTPPPQAISSGSTSVVPTTKPAAETKAQGQGADLDDMTVEALKLQRDKVEERIQAKQDAERLAIIKEIVSVVSTHNIPVDELVVALGGLKRKGTKAVQKFRDPTTGNTWSGRGKEPVWIRGKDRRMFQIS